MNTREYNFDGLVGPTHNYAGLSPGNLASLKHRGVPSNPRAAALQGLEKVRTLASLGVGQGVLPPQARPNFRFLHRLGFRGSEAEILDAAWRAAPDLLAAAYSASSMWAANAATVVPSEDSDDARVHILPANLVGETHRALEAPATAALLQRVFPAGAHFVHHPPLPATPALGDEGAANHIRLSGDAGRGALHLFVHGDAGPGECGPDRYPARQTRAASAAAARIFRLPSARVLLLRQHPAAIDAGVFHNDVIATGHENSLLVHEGAFAGGSEDLRTIDERVASECGNALEIALVPQSLVPLRDAVGSYLFNGQLVTRPGGSRLYLAPTECRENPRVRGWLEAWANGGAGAPELRYVDLRESMQNGGGPACLRLRLRLDAEEVAATHPGLFFSDDLDTALSHAIAHTYRDRLVPEDLRDPEFANQAREAWVAIMSLLGLGDLVDADLG